MATERSYTVNFRVSGWDATFADRTMIFEEPAMNKVAVDRFKSVLKKTYPLGTLNEETMTFTTTEQVLKPDPDFPNVKTKIVTVKSVFSKDNDPTGKYIQFLKVNADAEPEDMNTGKIVLALIQGGRRRKTRRRRTGRYSRSSVRKSMRR